MRAFGSRLCVALCTLALSLLAAAPASAAGSTFTIVASPSPSAAGTWLEDVSALGATSAWAVGSMEDSSVFSKTVIQRWNGSTWSTVASPNPGRTCGLNAGNQLHGVEAISATDAWAVGSFYDCSLYKTLAVRWNGTRWVRVATPNPGTDNYNELEGVSATSPTDVWAVGYFYANGEAPQPLALHWDGTKWTHVPAPSKNGISAFTDVVAIAPNDAWAVGYYYDPAEQTYESLLEHWNGTAWSIVANPAIAEESSNLYGVAASSSSNVWAVGYSKTYPNPALTLALRWNGVSWSRVASPNKSTTYGSGNVLLDVAVTSTTEAYAVGDWQSEQTNYHQPWSLAERWNGSRWSLATAATRGSASTLWG
ncbi:MAG: hypothetical protein LC722_08405, partial [Actinobacteria bacterium]|nr:hypothetical protein [Actinomycetota bacterium]